MLKTPVVPLDLPRPVKGNLGAHVTRRPAVRWGLLSGHFEQRSLLAFSPVLPIIW